MMADYIEDLTISIRVDNVRFKAVILPTGEYKIFGPLWGGGEVPVLGHGKLGYGFAMPGLQRSLAELIRLKLKIKI